MKKIDDSLNFLILRRHMRENGELSHIQLMLEFAESIEKAVEGKSKAEYLESELIRDA